MATHGGPFQFRSSRSEAVRALIVANHFLETELEKLRASVSTGYARGKWCRVIAGIGMTRMPIDVSYQGRSGLQKLAS